MASQALYLKWRPQRFEDVVGQEHVTTTLQNALQSGRISHAYLFSGPRGTGKTTMARLLAKAVNCLDEDVRNRPCNRCRMCQAINEGRLLDLIEMDAASHTGVDNVREAIRDKVDFRPTEARFKVYVIDEVHMLSTSAFNALLKTLEEPPEHVIFCLATTEPHKVLPTILSRCQQFDFHRIPLSALVGRLRYVAEQEGLQVEEQALQFIARTSTGCARDAISLLDQLTVYGDEVVTAERVRSVLGLSDEEAVFALIDALAAHDIGRGLDVIHQAVEGGADMRQLTNQIVDDLRSLLLLRVGGDTAVPDLDAMSLATLNGLRGRFMVRDLVRAIKLFNQAQLDLRDSDQSELVLELALVEAALADERVEPASEPPAEPARVAPAVRRPAAADEVTVSRPERGPGTPGQRVATEGSVAPRAAATSRVVREDESASSRPEAAGDDSEPPSAAPASGGGTIDLQEVEDQWPAIVQAIRARSPGVESFVASARSRRVENGNCVILEFPGTRNDPGFNFSAKKLAEESNRLLLEEVLSGVLGKPCTVRSVVLGASSPQADPVAAGPRPDQAPPGPDARASNAPPTGSDPVSSGGEWKAASDPLVQELVDYGGQVRDVHELSDQEEQEE